MIFRCQIISFTETGRRSKQQANIGNRADGKVQHRLKTMPDYPAIDKSKILAVIRSESKLLTALPTRTVQTEKLREFSDRNQFARKKTDPKKRLVVYEFSRISAEAQSEIDKAIKRILERLPESGE